MPTRLDTALASAQGLPPSSRGPPEPSLWQPRIVSASTLARPKPHPNAHHQCDQVSQTKDKGVPRVHACPNDRLACK